MSLTGCQIIPIDLTFHLQKCLEIFDKNSADNIQSKNYKEINPPCLMPIRVNKLQRLNQFEMIAKWYDNKYLVQKYFKTLTQLR